MRKKQKINCPPVGIYIHIDIYIIDAAILKYFKDKHLL